MMRIALVLGLASLAALPPTFAQEAGMVVRDDSAAEALGWRLSLQCWTLNHLTTFEAIDLAAGMGIRYLELYPGQQLRPDSDARTGHEMSAEARAELVAKLKKAKIKVVNYGVVGLSGNEPQDRAVFEFALAMGIETINTEPDPEALPAIAMLAKGYGVNVALHNHPKPSRYWDPEFAVQTLGESGKRLGLCADTGHWMRSGVDPVAALEKHGSRVITFHFKDLNTFGVRKAHDVPWCTGVGKTREILALLKKQGFRGVFSIEYEHHPPDQLERIAMCVKNFDAVARQLVADK